MRTSVPGILATGDVVENLSVLTGEPIWRPLGSTANKTGRVAGDVATGGDAEHRGVLGTGILRVFELGVAHTGLTEAEARKQGYDVVTHTDTNRRGPATSVGRRSRSRPCRPRHGRILGAQVVGPEGVDKRVDVLATAITFGATAEDPHPPRPRLRAAVLHRQGPITSWGWSWRRRSRRRARAEGG
jgi:NADPH-dependent 2,4-dienoyl-CoA reductase/sulfur reductase-like enzyme